MRYLGLIAVVVGLVAVGVGALLQAGGAASVVFCSTIGFGIVLVILGGVYWLVRALRHQTPGSMAA